MLWSNCSPGAAGDLKILLSFRAVDFFLLLWRSATVKPWFCLHNSCREQSAQDFIFFSNCTPQHIPKQGQNLGKLMELWKDTTDMHFISSRADQAQGNTWVNGNRKLVIKQKLAILNQQMLEDTSNLSIFDNGTSYSLNVQVYICLNFCSSSRLEHWPVFPQQDAVQHKAVHGTIQPWQPHAKAPGTLSFPRTPQKSPLKRTIKYMGWEEVCHAR